MIELTHASFPTWFKRKILILHYLMAGTPCCLLFLKDITTRFLLPCKQASTPRQGQVLDAKLSYSEQILPPSLLFSETFLEPKSSEVLSKGSSLFLRHTSGFLQYFYVCEGCCWSQFWFKTTGCEFTTAMGTYFLILRTSIIMYWLRRMDRGITSFSSPVEKLCTLQFLKIFRAQSYPII